MAILSKPSLQRRPATAPESIPSEFVLNASLVKGTPIRQRVLIAAQLQRNARRISSKQSLSLKEPLPPPVCAKLPLELLGEVFSHLSDDKPTLAHCTLVSRAWFFAARPQLFRRLEVSWISLANNAGWHASYMPGASENWDAYSRRCRRELGAASLTCALLRFFDAAGDLVRTSVRELRLVGWQHAACLLTLADVAALAVRLPALASLTLARTTIRWTPQDVPSDMHALRSLAVRDCVVSGSAGFGLLALFPALQDLVWDASDDPDECDIENEQLLGVLEGFAMPRLARLDVGRALYPNHAPEALALLVQGMCMRGAPPALETLELDVLLDDFDADSLESVLTGVGPGLKCLRMEAGCMYPDQAVSPVGLEYCFNLREFELSVPSYWVPDALRLIPGMLANLLADRETSASLDLALRFDSAFNSFEALRALDEALAGHLTRGLSAVTLRRSRRTFDEDEREKARQALPTLFDRGALRV
ncbi:F-box protein [Phanerochaete sordida]|uniref:F-box protein n=1 Tax=Phanerochaete sordida TaxID=48140 RepID=A0A9P3GM70_9APHY|nr:F-box protein [Phanerochaete sordida]